MFPSRQEEHADCVDGRHPADLPLGLVPCLPGVGAGDEREVRAAVSVTRVRIVRVPYSRTRVEQGHRPVRQRLDPLARWTHQHAPRGERLPIGGP
ncbi:hypothetical protein GCM10010166_10350 [Couchioplanes caeruleus subsp. azureus]|nr:hypothetical protein [Couchioplanes caeruleus]GGQ43802.1 hypothetical protein GCM10010166_10350 [Couchioplanes caeruleus subsp. azureus]